MIENTYRLDDEVLMDIARQVQVAFLTGTDVVDNLRTIRLSTSDSNEGILYLSEDYRENSETNIKSLLERAQNLQAEEPQE
jgi:hypothetical protein